MRVKTVAGAFIHRLLRRGHVLRRFIETIWGDSTTGFDDEECVCDLRDAADGA
jgi:hypothetical protein